MRAGSRGPSEGVRQEVHDSHALLGDPALAVLAHHQHGVVSTVQLRAAGLGRGAIEHRVRKGRLHRVHRGVYAVGHPRLTLRGRLWAAVLACGGPDAAALSHRSAAALWDLLPPPSGPVDVTSRRRSASTARLRVHRGNTLAEVADHDGLPLTTVARTLIDLADVLAPHALERTVHRAAPPRLLDTSALKHPGRPSVTGALATLAHDEPDVTRSELEERFLALVAKSRLPRPEVNANLFLGVQDDHPAREVDFLWRPQRLVAETDGIATHLTPEAFHRDRERDAALLTAGYRVVRFTYRQVTRQPAAVAATLRALLRAAPPPPARRAPPRSRTARSPA